MMQLATPVESLQAAVTRSGSQSAFARLCGVSQTAVWKWLQSGKRLPAEHVLVVERETGVSKHLLRPDIYPADPSFDPHGAAVALVKSNLRPAGIGSVSPVCGTVEQPVRCNRSAVFQSGAAR